MSEALYPTRFRWDRTRGIARHEGVSADFTELPELQGFEGATEADFVPGIIAAVRIGSDAIRDMTADEQKGVLKLLYRMASGARDALEGQSTLVVVIK